MTTPVSAAKQMVIAQPGPAPAATTNANKVQALTGDTLTIRKAGSAPAASLGIDFANFLKGFSSGDRLKVDSGFLNPVGGGGKIQTLASHALKAQLTITAFGSPVANLNLDIVREGEGYKMRSPEQWDLEVTQKGNTVTLRNKANLKQSITLTSIGPGKMQVVTKGLGQDGDLTIVKA